MNKFKIINQDYMKLLVATFVTRFGDAVGSIAFSWLIYVLTGSRVLMGTIFAVAMVPNIVVLPFSGVLADLWDKKWLTVFSDLFRGMGFLTIALLYHFDYLAVWHVFLIVILDSVFESLGDPARGSLLPSIVTEGDYLKASAYLSTARTIGEMSGMFLAGLSIAMVGIAGSFGVDAVSFLASALAIVLIHFEDRKSIKGDSDALKTEGYFTMIKAGFFYVKNKSLLVAIIVLAAFLNLLLVPFNVLMPVYVDEYLGLGPEGLSYLGIAMLLGMIIGSILMGRFGQGLPKIKTIGMGLMLMGCGYAMIGVMGGIQGSVIPPIVYVLVICGLSGMAIAVAQSPISALFMKETDPDMIGRTSGLMSMFVLCAMPLGGVFVSLVGEKLPVPLIYGILGIMAVVASLVFVLLNYHKEPKTLEIEV